MKNQRSVLNRAKKLRLRYLKQHVGESQARRHRNCQYNLEHSPESQGRSPDVVELTLAPREVITTLTVPDSGPAFLCMYGSESGDWAGDVCDDDDVARRCKWFKPRKSLEDARVEFMELLADDEWVYENHRDMAALQWVLGDRIHKHGLSLLDRAWIWIVSAFSGVAKPSPALPPFEDISDEDLRKGIVDQDLIGVWDDAPPEDPGV